MEQGLPAAEHPSPASQGSGLTLPVNAPGEARSDLWQLMEFSKRFTTDAVWAAEILDDNPQYKGKSLFDVLFKNGNVDKFPVSELDPAYENHESKEFGFYVREGLFEEFAQFGAGHGHDYAPFDTYQVTLYATDPISKHTDFKKCAVKVVAAAIADAGDVQ